MSSEEKRLINKPSTPRPEIDIVAYDVNWDTVYLLEVKSYLDSPGVPYDEVAIEQKEQSGRYKLLTAKNYRNVLSASLKGHWLQQGLMGNKTKISFGLIAGKIYRGREQEMFEYFKKQGWLFWGPSIIRDKVMLLGGKGYENNAVTIAAKILTR
ncbi:MAG: hypothetical protein EYC69_11740 [Bacteroidetes bacterium]|nr:MAG: hypothetical protein EYC69_11740 [Bacteroidota bacterium]